VTEENIETKGSTEPEMVAISDASDEDLSSFLDSVKNEAHDDSESADNSEDQPAAEKALDAQSVPEKTESPNETTAPSKVDSETAIRDQVAKMQRQLDGQELLLKRRTSRIAEMEREFGSLKEQLTKKIEETRYDDPLVAMEAKRALDDNEAQLEAEKSEVAEEQRVLEAKKVVSHFLKPGEASIEAIQDCLAEDGFDANYASQFAQNPLQHALPETIIQLGKRAAERTKFMQVLQRLVPYAQQLEEENKRLKGNPESVIQGVEKALRQPSHMGAGSGGSVGEQGANVSDVGRWSDSQLEEFLKKQKR
jgi:hypothetical protein